MKRIVITLILCVIGANALTFAQQRTDEQRKKDFERFKQERKAFISKEIDLSADVSEEFWNLCDELQQKKFELNMPLRVLIRENRQAAKDGKSISDADYRKMVELSASIKVKEAQLEEEYTGRFLKILPAEKVYKYFKAEQNFARKMMEPQDHNRREGGNRSRQ